MADRKRRTRGRLALLVRTSYSEAGLGKERCAVQADPECLCRGDLVFEEMCSLPHDVLAAEFLIVGCVSAGGIGVLIRVVVPLEKAERVTYFVGRVSQHRDIVNERRAGA